MNTITHIPVLLEECLELLHPQKGDVFFDGTLGGGGHAIEILTKISPSGKYIATDLDNQTIDRTLARLAEYKNISVHNTSFKNIIDVAEKEKIVSFNKILLDLGWNSDQFKDELRGFSFLGETLDMRYDTEGEVTAYDIVNDWSYDTLVTLFKAYGEESHARKIAYRITEERKLQKFISSKQLAEFIEIVIPRRGKKIHPATKVFQALRITVNNELGDVEEFLQNVLRVTQKGTRIGIITFHSLEDRIVKNFMRDLIKDGKAIDINYKGATASDEELLRNPRSRSARLRVIEII